MKKPKIGKWAVYAVQECPNLTPQRGAIGRKKKINSLVRVKLKKGLKTHLKKKKINVRRRGGRNDADR